MTAGEAAPRSAVVVNPVKVTDLDDFRRTVNEALAAAGWPEPAWHETTVEDPATEPYGRRSAPPATLRGSASTSNDRLCLTRAGGGCMAVA